jgi:hypothetical protein
MSKQKLNLTSGSFITAAYPAWLARLARKPVRLSGVARPALLSKFHFFRERLAGMRQTKPLVDRIKIGLAIAMLATLTGCIGWVGGGGYDGGWWGGDGGWWWDDGGWWGGGHGYDRGRDVHGFSARGAASRGAAHGGGGGGHGGGGGGHGGGGGGRR